jgi:hypothetical protein
MKRALLALAWALPGLQEEPAFTAEGTRYVVESTADRKHAQELLKYMDLCFETYRRFLNAPTERLPRDKFTLVLYRDAREYKARGGTGRYGHYDGRQLVGFFDAEQMFPTFAHEGMHQFTDVCVPNSGRLPPWYTEGIAECIANNEIVNGRLVMCLRRGPIPRLRAPAVREAIRSGKFIRIKDLLVMGPKKFQDNHAICYAESWLFCHFLLTFPKQEDPSMQIPEGKHKQVVVRFHNAMLNPKTKVEEAVRQAFVHDRKPIDLDELEAEFKEYALSFDVDRPKEE